MTTTSPSLPEQTEDTVYAGLRLLSIALLLAVVYHGALLPFTHGNTYDAFIHMFFADGYHRSWFDVWEPRWYTGFNTTSYPPGAHMAIAVLMYVMPLRAAFVVVQLASILMLTVGVFRFSRLWVGDRAAGYASICLVLASSVSETVHIFGQLPTICALALFLNGVPWMYRWIIWGGLRNLGAALMLTAATTAVHHITAIFGGVLFVAPLTLYAWVTYLRRCETEGLPFLRRLVIWLSPAKRGLCMAVLMVGVMVLTIYPYWVWSVSDPITQVPIPHGSRESFIDRPDLGFIFFLLPWGVSLLFIPCVAMRTVTSRLWPLGVAVLVCFLLGTGGTTGLPRAILGGAFNILTLDRFTFWATVLILPFLGLVIDSLFHGPLRRGLREALGPLLHRAIVAGLFLSMAAVSMLAAVLPSIRPTQPGFIDPAPIVQFLESDKHDRWRYLTLGFGDQFAYLSARTTALSVDGNYHSARRLPQMTQYSVERLENAKYMGVPGLGSLRQFLVNASRYNLKYVFSNDGFYDPLLFFTGWAPLNRFENGVVVWERPDTPPLPAYVPRRTFPVIHQVMWGILPPLALVLAALVLVGGALGGARRVDLPTRPTPHPDQPLDVRRIRMNAAAIAGLTICILLGIGVHLVRSDRRPLTPSEVLERYFDQIDARRYDRAFELQDPETRGTLEDAMFAWRWRGGLLAYYSQLNDLRILSLESHGDLAEAELQLDWLTAVDLYPERRSVRLVRRDGHWFIVPVSLQPWQTPEQLQRGAQVVWTTNERRQPLPDPDVHRDQMDRPRVAASGARLVRHDGRLSVVGQVTNVDPDPAHVTLDAEALAHETPQATETAALVMGHRLRPSESAGFRVTFENVLSLEDGETHRHFDPSMFIPPEFDQTPDGAAIDLRSVVRTDGMYRGIALSGLQVTPREKGLRLTALATNSGFETATVSAVNVLLYDRTGLPIWAEVGLTETNLYPGQSAPFALDLPACDHVELVADIPPDQITSNGGTQEPGLPIPGADKGTWPLNGLGGCQSARLHVSTMTFQPLN